MTLTKIYATTVIIATILVIAVAAAAITTTSFPNANTVFATLQTPEQAGDNATMSTTTPPTSLLTEVGGQGQQQQIIHITKASTNSYLLYSNLSSANVGSFDTTYTVVGERSAVRSAENPIISTITYDFRSSPTIGYISTGNSESPRSSPFATPEQVTERITNELRRAISEAGTNRAQSPIWEIQCDFGMTLEQMLCHYVGPSPGGINFLENLPLEPGGLVAPNTTNNTNITAPISPLE
jgi:hypothetical protein